MSTSHLSPVNQSLVVLHQAIVSFTRHRSTRHQGTRHRSPVNQAMYFPVINHQSSGHQTPRHQLTSHLIPSTDYWVPVTCHKSLVIIRSYHAMDTSHWATRQQSLGTRPITGHQSLNSNDCFEHWVANYLKGILCNHYRMNIRILNIPNYH